MGIFHLKGHYTLTLIFYPAPGMVDWSSPGHLLRSMVKNTFTGWRSGFNYQLSGDDWVTKKNLLPVKHPHPISHVDVVLTDVSGKASYSGMGRIKTIDEITSALQGKSTFDKLFKTYPGYIYDEIKIKKWLLGLLDHDEVNWLTFKISADTFSILKNFEEEYQRLGFHNTYAGFHADPFKGEGAGCAMYAKSFMEIANVNSPELEKIWKKSILIPNHLLPDHKPRPSLSVIDMILLSKNGSWATENEPHVRVDLYDPGIMYDHLKSNVIGEKQKIRNSFGSVVDKTAVSAKPGPYFKI